MFYTWFTAVEPAWQNADRVLGNGGANYIREKQNSAWIEAHGFQKVIWILAFRAGREKFGSSFHFAILGIV